jgi:lipoprotein NlpD
MRVGSSVATSVRRTAAVGLALLLAACASTTVVREEAPRRPTSSAPRPAAAPAARPSGPLHTVAAGDTLYGIALRNRLDWREVARWNDIGEPFVIKPGQVLRLSPPRAATVAPPPVASGPPPIPRGPAGASGPVASTPKPVTTPAAPAPRPATPTATPPPAPSPAPPPAPVSTPTGPAGVGAFRPGQWQWPTQGQVVSRYAEGDKARQGIAIAGTAGQPVRAAAAGTVVYSGAGLVGYGELIIIKHSDEWLSAYGHNRRRLVAEGASISAGQQIAELGRTGTSRDMLHFEIRRNGRPVDPAPLLPRR